MTVYDFVALLCIVAKRPGRVVRMPTVAILVWAATVAAVRLPTVVPMRERVGG